VIVGVVVGCVILVGDFVGMMGVGVSVNPCPSLQLRINNVSSAASLKGNLWWETLLRFILFFLFRYLIPVYINQTCHEYPE
jgi:hypothetical protein